MADTRPRDHDFGDLRAAATLLEEILSIGGRAVPDGDGIKLSGIPRKEWRRISAGAARHGQDLKALVSGPPRRGEATGRREAALAVIAKGDGDDRCLEIAILDLMGRAITGGLLVNSAMPDWRSRIQAFLPWDEIETVLPAAEGNNQRAAIGLVLSLCGIGRGRLEMIEAEIPKEDDEAAHMVRGSEILKTGLPRFGSATGEALWYLFRIRGVHSRMIVRRKQGYYTSLALTAGHAAGCDMDTLADSFAMGRTLVERMLPGEASDTPSPGPALPVCLSGVSGPASEGSARRIWFGAGLHVRALERRIQIGRDARRRLGLGDDLISIADDARLARRDLVRILSISQADAELELDRFRSAIVDPDLVGRVVAAARVGR